MLLLPFGVDGLPPPQLTIANTSSMMPSMCSQRRRSVLLLRVRTPPTSMMPAIPSAPQTDAYIDPEPCPCGINAALPVVETVSVEVAGTPATFSVAGENEQVTSAGKLPQE